MPFYHRASSLRRRASLKFVSVLQSSFVCTGDSFVQYGYLAPSGWRLVVKFGDSGSSGGVARYFRTDAGENARVSTEITGYTLSTLLFLYERTGDSAYLDRALCAARFLTGTAWDAHLQTFPFEYSANGDQSPECAYFFDCGIIVRGCSMPGEFPASRNFAT